MSQTITITIETGSEGKYATYSPSGNDGDPIINLAETTLVFTMSNSDYLIINAGNYQYLGTGIVPPPQLDITGYQPYEGSAVTGLDIEIPSSEEYPIGIEPSTAVTVLNSHANDGLFAFSFEFQANGGGKPFWSDPQIKNEPPVQGR